MKKIIKIEAPSFLEKTKRMPRKFNPTSHQMLFQNVYKTWDVRLLSSSSGKSVFEKKVFMSSNILTGLVSSELPKNDTKMSNLIFDVMVIIFCLDQPVRETIWQLWDQNVTPSYS